MVDLGHRRPRQELAVNLRQEDGGVVLGRQVSTRWPAVRAFLAEVQARSAAAGGYLVIVEVCGFNDWLLALLNEYGAREIVLLHPEKPSRQKTDRRDANRLGELLWVNRARLLAWQRVQGLRRVAITRAPAQHCRALTRLRWRGQPVTRQPARPRNQSAPRR